MTKTTGLGLAVADIVSTATVTDDGIITGIFDESAFGVRLRTGVGTGATDLCEYIADQVAGAGSAGESAATAVADLTTLNSLIPTSCRFTGAARKGLFVTHLIPRAIAAGDHFAAPVVVDATVCADFFAALRSTGILVGITPVAILCGIAIGRVGAASII